ncbi:MAG: MarC family protein [Firmicutes bacterium]|nr:MarC family protein [Bacillota bacterium]
MLKHIIESAVTFFVVIDPVGTVPLFIVATKGKSVAEQRSIALKATIISAAILIFFIAVGQLLFDHLGIGLNAFRIAGGLVLLIISLKMILESEITGMEAEDENSEHKRDVAVFPIALPFIAGPGTIMAAVLLTDNDLYSVFEQFVVSLVLLGILLITWIVLRYAKQLEKLLGDTGINVVTRVMGLILAALACQTILNGIQGYFKLG